MIDYSNESSLVLQKKILILHSNLDLDKYSK